jgi:hypothetical protein
MSVAVDPSDEVSLSALESGPLHRFSDWPNPGVPAAAFGVYTVWLPDGRLLYVAPAPFLWIFTPSGAAELDLPAVGAERATGGFDLSDLAEHAVEPGELACRADNGVGCLDGP